MSTTDPAPFTDPDGDAGPSDRKSTREGPARRGIPDLVGNGEVRSSGPRSRIIVAAWGIE